VVKKSPYQPFVQRPSAPGWAYSLVYFE